MAQAIKQKESNAFYEKASPTVLAMQGDPEEDKATSAAEQKAWNNMRGHLEARLIALRNWRNSWWMENWSNLSQYILPRRSIWLTQSAGGLPSANNMTRGQPINNAIKDPTATYATRVCAAGLMSGLASPSRPWFKVTVATKGYEPDDEGRQWMDETEDRVYTVLAGSNFYNAFAQECEDLVVFGTGPNIMYEDARDLIRCYNPTIGEYYLSSDATLRVDGLYRSFVMTVSQIVDFFGIENCPGNIRKLWQEKGSSLDKESIVAHSIEPDFTVQGAEGFLKGDFAWREVYWLYGAGSAFPLSRRGFIEEPFTAARWATQSNDAYGRSPGMDALPDVIQLQVETMRKAEGIEKGLRPPLLADMTMKNQPSSLLPGHVTYVNSLGPGTGMRSIYEVNFDLDHVTRDIAEIQQRIKIGLFNDLFLMLEQMPKEKMTAYEVSARLNEKMQVIGPVIENLITESLKPKLKRVFRIMTRKNLLPPMPDSMKGIALDIEFTSLLAVAQKAAATGGLERIVGLVGNMAGVYPEVRDVLDPEKFIREFNSLLSNPNKILRSPEDVKKIREQQQKAMQAQQQQAEMVQGVDTAKVGADAANVLSNTEVGQGGNALSMLLGGGGVH